MFKIAKLEKVNNEVVSIDYTTQEHSKYENGKKVSETFKTLTFDISGDNYSFSFDLNCKLEKLLDIPMNETIDFSDYIFEGETFLNINELNVIDPNMNIKITRYLKNRFIVLIYFNTDYSYDADEYVGMIEFTFNLDDYLDSDKVNSMIKK